jgi:archaeal type IV pilus assembly protein PilA
MKKIWAMRKETDGVSPVIATILMVAITVVLAAVLYVMVLGIGGPGTTVPAVGTTKGTTATSYTWTITAIGSGASILKSDVYVQIKNGTTGLFSLQTTVLTATATLTAAGLTYSSASAGNYISVGDIFSLAKTGTLAFTQGSTVTLVTSGAAGQYAVLTV